MNTQSPYIETDAAKFIITTVKKIVAKYDENAELILFGSRARGDWHEESDWDFMILSSLPEGDDAKEKIRKDIYLEIELETFDSIFILLHNKEVWKNKYSITPLFYNITEEGIVVWWWMMNM